MFKSKILAQYFISYIVLLIVVFGVLTSMYAYMISFTRSRIEDSVISQYEQFSLYFGEKMSEFKNMADLMCNNENLTHYKLSNTSYTAVGGINELKKIGVSNKSIYDLFMCYDDGYVYSMKGKTKMDVYAENVLRLSPESSGLMNEILLKHSEAGYYALYSSVGTAEGQPAYMLCTYPLNTYGASIGMIGFVVQTDMIKKNLVHVLGEFGVGVRMILPSGEFFADVYRNGKKELFADGNRNENLRYFHNKDATGFGLDIAIDSDGAFSYIRQMQRLSYIIISIVFSASLLISYVFSKRHYKPIKTLRNMVQRNDKALTGNVYNEFDVIARAMRHDQDENRKLLQKLDDSSFILRQQACGLLFSGVFQDESNILELVQLSGIRMEEPYFSVIMVVWSGKESENLNGSRIDNQLCKRFGGYYATYVTGKKTLVFIAGLNDWDTGRKKRKQIADELRNCFKAENKTDIRFFFGRVYNESSFISTSYNEAVICFEKNSISGENNDAVFFESLADLEKSSYSLDVQDTNRLIKHLRNRNLAKSITCFDEIMEKLNNKNLSPDVQKFHHYDLLHLIFHSFKQYIESMYASDIVNIDCLSAEKFARRMKRMFRFICNEKLYTMHTDSICEIINYIEENYTRNELTLAFLASKFHISQNYISTCFKLKTGENYIDYLSRLRMKKAYQLVCNTDMTINDIACEVGYLDSANFAKKFKKTYQCTPTEMRLRLEAARRS